MTCRIDNALGYSSTRERFADWLVTSALPVGWFVLLSGMFWLGSRQLYSQSFYLLIAVPAFLALVLRPANVRLVLSNPLVLAFLPFAAYMIVTISWSGTESSVKALLERPLYVFLLLSASCLMAAHARRKMQQSTVLVAWTASVAAALSLGHFYFFSTEPRLSGYGALINPLLTSHVFGLFLALWIADWAISEKKLSPARLACIAILMLLILATGSRTPLVGIAAVTAWLALTRGDRRTILALGGLALAALPLLAGHLDELSSRGLSYRPDIWKEALRQISLRPWLGYGMGHPVVLPIAGIDAPFADPHNIHLAVLFHGGIVGLALWMLLNAVAFVFSWRNRRHPMVLIGSSLLVFGLAASMTEGGGFFSRPREHWFLIWLPLSMLAAAWTATEFDKRASGQDGQ